MPITCTFLAILVVIATGNVNAKCITPWVSSRLTLSLERSHRTWNLEQEIRCACVQGVTEGWQACQDWETADGGVNLQFLSEKFGDARIWATASARFEYEQPPPL